MRLKTAGQRLDILTVVLVAIFLALSSRLAYLQVMKGPEYQRLAEGNRTRQVNVVAPRGDFFDRNGVTLVTSRPGFVVSIVPGNKPVPLEVVSKTAALLGLDPREIADKLAKTEFVPRDLRNRPDAIMACVLAGHELGIQPMQALAQVS